MVYRLPVLIRLCLATAGLWLMALPLLFPQAGFGPLETPVAVAFTGMGLLLLCLGARRYELSLDQRRHTYRLIRGWLIWSQVQLGTYDDFAGVFVRPSPALGGGVWVGLAWRNGEKSRPYLGCYPDPAKASVAALELESAFGLPLVTAPDPGGFGSQF
jgi:hypothetical protein